MPKIQVNEKDMSWYYRQRESGAVTVFMPLVATFGPDKVPTLTDESNFTQVYGKSAVGDDISFKMAASLVKSGFNVLGYRVPLDKASQASSTYAEITFGEGKATTSEITITITDEEHGDLLVYIPVGSSSVKVSPDYADALVTKLEEVKESIGLKDGTISKGDTKYIGGKPDGEDGKYSADNHLEIKSKYPGTYGNAFSVRTTLTGSLLYVQVKDDSGLQIDGFTAELFDSSSDKYWELVNEESPYVEIDVVGTVDETWKVDKEAFSLYGGSNGTPGEESLSDVVVKALVNDDSTGPSKELIALQDPYQYSVDVIFDGGFNKYTEEVPTKISSVDKALLTIAEGIGTALYLVGGSKAWEDPATFMSYCGLIDSSYAAAFGPWGYTKMTYDGSVGLTPGTYAMMISWAQSVAVGNPVWMAPAGVKRAQLSSFYRRPLYEIGSAVLDQWQNQEYIGDSHTYKVNPIMKLKQYGYCIYGNSTLLHNRPDGSTSMLQSFSVRVLANLIKKQAFDVSLNLQFDQLTDDLFAQFKTLMTTYMDQLRYGGALYDYEIIVDRSAMTNADLQNKRVPVKIRISPNPAAENFIIDLEISQAGVSFSDDTDESEIA